MDNLRPIKAVLFDYYGVIEVDPLRAWRQDHRLDDQQWRHVESLCQRSDSGQVTLDQFYDQLGQIVGLDGRAVCRQLDKMLGVNPAMIELVREIRRADLKVGIVSNSGSTLVDAMHKRHLASFFDEVVVSAEVGMVKPHPDIFRLAVERFGLKPAEVLFFDDRQTNVTGARAAGLQAELFTSAPHCRAQLATRIPAFAAQ